MKILFLASRLHMAGSGGAGAYTRACCDLLRAAVPDGAVRIVEISEPFARWPRSVRQAVAVVTAPVVGLPAKSLFAFDRGATARVRRMVEDWSPDLLVVNHAELLPLVADLPRSLRVMLIAHNVECRVLERMKATSARGKGPRAFLIGVETARFRRLEEDLGRRIGNVLCISDADQAWFDGLRPGMRTLVVPPTFAGAPYTGPRPQTGSALRLGLVAKMSWWSNREAVDWFVGRVLPRLERDDIEVHLFGPGSEVYRGADRRLTAHGFVESLDPAWRDCHFHLCPTSLNSGANIKLAEALYNGVPVLATPAAARPYASVPHGGAIAVRPPEEWAAFLDSAAAAGLAETVVSDACRRHFCPDAWVPAVKAFVTDVAS